MEQVKIVYSHSLGNYIIIKIDEKYLEQAKIVQETLQNCSHQFTDNTQFVPRINQTVAIYSAHNKKWSRAQVLKVDCKERECLVRYLEVAFTNTVTFLSMHPVPREISMEVIPPQSIQITLADVCPVMVNFFGEVQPGGQWAHLSLAEIREYLAGHKVFWYKHKYTIQDFHFGNLYLRNGNRVVNLANKLVQSGHALRYQNWLEQTQRLPPKALEELAGGLKMFTKELRLKLKENRRVHARSASVSSDDRLARSSQRSNAAQPRPDQPDAQEPLVSSATDQRRKPSTRSAGDTPLARRSRSLHRPSQNSGAVARGNVFRDEHTGCDQSRGHVFRNEHTGCDQSRGHVFRNEHTGCEQSRGHVFRNEHTGCDQSRGNGRNDENTGCAQHEAGQREEPTVDGRSKGVPAGCPALAPNGTEALASLEPRSGRRKSQLTLLVEKYKAKKGSNAEGASQDERNARRPLQNGMGVGHKNGTSDGGTPNGGTYGGTPNEGTPIGATSIGASPNGVSSNRGPPNTYQTNTSDNSTPVISPASGKQSMSLGARNLMNQMLKKNASGGNAHQSAVTQISTGGGAASLNAAQSPISPQLVATGRGTSQSPISPQVAGGSSTLNATPSPISPQLVATGRGTLNATPSPISPQLVATGRGTLNATPSPISSHLAGGRGTLNASQSPIYPQQAPGGMTPTKVAPSPASQGESPVSPPPSDGATSRRLSRRDLFVKNQKLKTTNPSAATASCAVPGADQVLPQTSYLGSCALGNDNALKGNVRYDSGNLGRANLNVENPNHSLNASSADSSVNVSHTDSNVNGSYADSNVNGSYADSNVNGSYTDSNVNGSYADSNVNGSYADLNVNGSYTDSNVNGSYADSNVNASYADSNVNGSYTDSNVNGSYADSNVNGSYTNSNVNGSYTNSNVTGSYTNSNVNGSYTNSNVNVVSPDSNENVSLKSAISRGRSQSRVSEQPGASAESSSVPAVPILPPPEDSYLGVCRPVTHSKLLPLQCNEAAPGGLESRLHHSIVESRHFPPVSVAQVATVPALLQRRHVCAVHSLRSQRNSAYLGSLLSLLVQHKSRYFRKRSFEVEPLVLILAPNSRICEDLHAATCCFIGKFCDVTVKTIYGSSPDNEKHALFSAVNGCDILITTPRCLDRLKESRIVGLSWVYHYVLERADILLEKFSKEVSTILSYLQVISKARQEKAASTLSSDQEKAASTLCPDLQIILSSETYTKKVENFLRNKMTQPVLVLSNFLEAAIYGQVEFSLSIVLQQEAKLSYLLEILRKYSGRGEKLAILCASAADVRLVAARLAAVVCAAAELFPVHAGLNILDTHRLMSRWQRVGKHAEAARVVLVCDDEAMCNIFAEDVTVLIHYSLPRSKSAMARRFKLLKSALVNLFEDRDGGQVPCGRSHLILDESNDVQFFDLIMLAKRLRLDVPCRVLDQAKAFRLAREGEKRNVPLCHQLLMFGACDLSPCGFRHAFVPALDAPAEHLPKEGKIKFTVLGALDGSCFAIRIFHTQAAASGEWRPHRDHAAAIHLALKRRFATREARATHYDPGVGDVVAVENANGLVTRARVLETLRRGGGGGEGGEVSAVRVRFCDAAGKPTEYPVSKIFVLPPELKRYPDQVVLAFATGVLPIDEDVHWNLDTCHYLESLVKERMRGGHDNYFVGKIVLALNNIYLLDPFQCCQYLPSSSVEICHFSVRHALLTSGRALPHPAHLRQLYEQCAHIPGSVPEYMRDKAQEVLPVSPFAELPPPKWAILRQGELQECTLAGIVDPSLFFLQLNQFRDVLRRLNREIQADVARTTSRYCREQCGPGLLCLARPDHNGGYNRAQVTDTEDPHVARVLFVDFSDKQDVRYEQLVPIHRPQLVSSLPFQAIECCLAGVEPVEERWSQAAYDFLDDFNHLFARVVSVKLQGVETGGRQYAVELFEWEERVNLNKQLVVLRHAKYTEEATLLLTQDDEAVFKEIEKLMKTAEEEDDSEEWEDLEDKEEYLGPRDASTAVATSENHDDDLVINEAALLEEDLTGFLSQMDPDFLSEQKQMVESIVGSSNLPALPSSSHGDGTPGTSSAINTEAASSVLNTSHEKSHSSRDSNSHSNTSGCNLNSHSTNSGSDFVSDSNNCGSNSNFSFDRSGCKSSTLEKSGGANHSRLDIPGADQHTEGATLTLLPDDIDPAMPPLTVHSYPARAQWYQRGEHVFVHLLLPGLHEGFTLAVEEKFVHFCVEIEDRRYENQLPLLGHVCPSESRCEWNGFELRLKLAKQLRSVEWPCLLQDGCDKEVTWLSYHADHLCDNEDVVSSDDDEFMEPGPPTDGVKGIRGKTSLSSEDEDSDSEGNATCNVPEDL